MKFGAWSYTGYYVDLKQLPQGSIFIQKIIILLSLNLLAINSVSGFFFCFTDQVMNGIDKYGQDVETMKIGMDLSFFYQ